MMSLSQWELQLLVRGYGEDLELLGKGKGIANKVWKDTFLMCHIGRDHECKALKSSPVSQRLTDYGKVVISSSPLSRDPGVTSTMVPLWCASLLAQACGFQCGCFLYDIGSSQHFVILLSVLWLLCSTLVGFC